VNALENCRRVLERISYDRLLATGYGRYLAQTHLACPVITEIKAYAVGAHHVAPGCEMVIDIGGQDSKVIRTFQGRVEDFEMNDRCAAGTGRFLEVMATVLGYSIGEIGDLALKADHASTINSMCTVFAESEVVSLISKGEDPKCIAYGLHNSIANRIFSMLGRIGIRDRVVFAGGVAKNSCMIALLEKRLGQKLIVPDEPQLVGSIGAALSANGG
jgi:predicted CoA-substrate-specific enzyme activase